MERPDMSVGVILVFLILPAYADSDALRLEDELAHFVLLALLGGLDILPTEDAATDGARDVADGVLACDQIARYRFALESVGKRRVVGVDVRRVALHKIGTAVAAGETFG